MENIIDLIATDSSASEISDAIKNVIYSKTMEKIDEIRPEIASSLFAFDDESTVDDVETSEDYE
jgi:hypothetical protein